MCGYKLNWLRTWLSKIDRWSFVLFTSRNLSLWPRVLVCFLFWSRSTTGDLVYKKFFRLCFKARDSGIKIYLVINTITTLSVQSRLNWCFCWTFSYWSLLLMKFRCFFSRIFFGIKISKLSSVFHFDSSDQFI